MITGIGQWRTGKGYCGQMKQKSIGLSQMGRCIPGRRGENHFLTGLPPLLSSMEGVVTSWYGGVWGGME
jgi:hypothetical protein